MAARSKELDQVFEMFSAPRVQRGGIIHAMPQQGVLTLNDGRAATPEGARLGMRSEDWYSKYVTSNDVLRLPG